MSRKPLSVFDLCRQPVGKYRGRTAHQRAFGVGGEPGERDPQQNLLAVSLRQVLAGLDTPDRAYLSDLLDAWPQVAGSWARFLEVRALHHAKPDTLVVACSSSAVRHSLSTRGGLAELQQRLSDHTAGRLRKIFLVLDGATPKRAARKAKSLNPAGGDRG